MCVIKGETKNFEYKEEKEKKVKIGHTKMIKEKKRHYNCLFLIIIFKNYE